MRLYQLISDDDAVSPVIGVILMVAITVILAAVIASFVLGLGDSQTVAPQASMDADYDADEGNVTITHGSGDAIVATEVYFRGSGFTGEDYSNKTWANHTSTVSGEIEGKSAITAGDQADINATNAYELRVVWESPEGDSSDTLLEDSGPQA